MLETKQSVLILMAVAVVYVSLYILRQNQNDSNVHWLAFFGVTFGIFTVLQLLMEKDDKSTVKFLQPMVLLFLGITIIFAVKAVRNVPATAEKSYKMALWLLIALCVGTMFLILSTLDMSSGQDSGLTGAKTTNPAVIVSDGSPLDGTNSFTRGYTPRLPIRATPIVSNLRNRR